MTSGPPHARLMCTAAGASDQKLCSLTFSDEKGQLMPSTFVTSTCTLPAELKEDGNFTISTFCVPACQPVAKKTVEVKSIPMRNDLMSMEFIQSQACGS